MGIAVATIKSNSQPPQSPRRFGYLYNEGRGTLFPREHVHFSLRGAALFPCSRQRHADTALMMNFCAASDGLSPEPALREIVVKQLPNWQQRARGVPVLRHAELLKRRLTS